MLQDQRVTNIYTLVKVFKHGALLQVLLYYGAFCILLS